MNWLETWIADYGDRSSHAPGAIPMNRALATPLDDGEIRTALKERLHKDGAKLIVEEFELFGGKSRVDLFTYNNFFTGIEIKSEKDSLSRIAQQSHFYNMCFEKIEIVIGKNHLQKTLQTVPKWWGITTAMKNTAGDIKFSAIRYPLTNPLFRPNSLIQFLWRDEILQLLALYGHSNGFRSMARYHLRHLARTYVSYHELKFFVLDFMQKRTNWRPAVQPKSDGD